MNGNACHTLTACFTASSSQLFFIWSFGTRSWVVFTRLNVIKWHVQNKIFCHAIANWQATPLPVSTNDLKMTIMLCGRCCHAIFHYIFPVWANHQQKTAVLHMVLFYNYVLNISVIQCIHFKKPLKVW